MLAASRTKRRELRELLEGDAMSDAIKAILDAVTNRVLSYRPKDKGQQAKKIERRVKRQRKKEED